MRFSAADKIASILRASILRLYCVYTTSIMRRQRVGTASIVQSPQIANCRTLAITRYTASLSRHALSYFHFHLSLVPLQLLLDTLLSLSLDTQCIFWSLSLFFCCCTRSCCLSFSSWYNARVPLTAWYSFCLWVRKLSTLPSVVY